MMEGLVLLAAGLLLGAIFFVTNALFKKTKGIFKIFAHFMDFAYALFAGAAYFSVIYTVSDGKITPGPLLVYLAGIFLAYRIIKLIKRALTERQYNKSQK